MAKREKRMRLMGVTGDVLRLVLGTVFSLLRRTRRGGELTHMLPVGYLTLWLLAVDPDTVIGGLAYHRPFWAMLCDYRPRQVAGGMVWWW